MAVSAYDTMVERLIERFTPEEVLSFEASSEEQERVHDLLDRNNAGTLTQQEQMELERAIAFEQLFVVLKARAIKTLRQKS
jgi:hypothetical protein